MSTYTSSSPIATEAELTGTSTATTGTAAVINSNQQIPSARHLRLLDVLQHATYCSASNNTCEYNPSCQQMKQLLHHASTCLNGGSNCIICKDVHRLLTEHAQECEEQSCQVFKCQDLRYFCSSKVKLSAFVMFFIRYLGRNSLQSNPCMIVYFHHIMLSFRPLKPRQLFVQQIYLLFRIKVH